MIMIIDIIYYILIPNFLGVYGCVCLDVFRLMHVCLHVHLYVGACGLSVFACVCVCLCVTVHMPVCTCTFSCVHVHMHVSVRLRTQLRYHSEYLSHRPHASSLMSDESNLTELH